MPPKTRKIELDNKAYSFGYDTEKKIFTVTHLIYSNEGVCEIERVESLGDTLSLAAYRAQELIVNKVFGLIKNKIKKEV